MGQYSVPEVIRKHKPKGTMVKLISGHYYVYKYSNYTDSHGKRHTKMGELVGSIKPGTGFIPNSNLIRTSAISSLDFGEYAVTMANSQKTLALLKKYFNPQDAVTIYLVAMIHFIHGFTYLRDIHNYYEMSVLSVRYPSLKLGYTALAKLYDALGRRQSNVLAMEEGLIAASSHQVAIDGHAIGCESQFNDLSKKGYKFRKLGEEQINLLMAYDINTGIPLISRIYEGASTDKVSIKDFLNQIDLKNMLFIVDRGFYSTENIKLLSSYGNAYIIPLSRNLIRYKTALSSLEMRDRFMYQKGKRASVIEYKEEIIDGARVLSYRDLNESTAEQGDYLQHLARGNKAYSKEIFEKVKDYFGVIVLQTNLMDKTPQEIYELYKKRWTIEGFYNYFKNKANYSALYADDYYKTQGLAFIMLVAALIHQEVKTAVSVLPNKNIETCLLEAKMVKLHKRHGEWTICNCLKKQLNLFKNLQTPLEEFTAYLKN